MQKENKIVISRYIIKYINEFHTLLNMMLIIHNPPVNTRLKQKLDAFLDSVYFFRIRCMHSKNLPRIDMTIFTNGDRQGSLPREL